MPALIQSITRTIGKVATHPEAQGVAIATAASALNKYAGANARMADVKQEPAYVRHYVAKREAFNIGLATAMNLGVQTLLNEPAKKLMPHISKEFRRMIMIVPAMYASEYLARQVAGKGQVQKLQAATSQQDDIRMLEQPDNGRDGVTFSAFNTRSRFKLANP